jgi:hypothetical protein
MVELILIDDDKEFMRTVQSRFQDRARFYLSDPKEPCPSGMDLVRQHPDAFVFIDLYIKDKHGRQLTGGVQLAEILINDWKLPPDRLRFCSNNLGEEVPREVLEKILLLNISYFNKAHLVEEIEKLLTSNPAANPVSSKRRRSRDEKWCLNEAAVRRQFAGQIVAVYDRKVWASGADVAAVLKAAQAQQGCPPLADLVLASLPDDKQEFFPLLRVPLEQSPKPSEPSVPHNNE